MKLLSEYCKNHGASDDQTMMSIITDKCHDEYLTPDAAQLVDCLVETAKLKCKREHEDIKQIQEIVAKLCRAYAAWGFSAGDKRRKDLVAQCRKYYDAKFASIHKGEWDERYQMLWFPKERLDTISNDDPDLTDVINTFYNYLGLAGAPYESEVPLKPNGINIACVRPFVELPDKNGRRDPEVRILSETGLCKAVRAAQEAKAKDYEDDDVRWYSIHTDIADAIRDDLKERYLLHIRGYFDPVVAHLMKNLSNGQSFEQYLWAKYSEYQTQLEDD